LSRVLVLAWGNPSRGDDGLGPALADRVPALAARSPHVVRVETDYQLAPEHAVDLAECDAAIFVDASVGACPPFEFGPVEPARDRSFTSHAMSPAAVLAACRDAFGAAPRAAYALAIRGDSFELGSSLSPTAAARLEAAAAFLARVLARPDVDRLDVAQEHPSR
jgi:hydrogenase maturation protease